MASNAEDNVLTAWRSLKMGSNDSIQRYVDKFWDLHLKATVYKKIDFSEQKQQLCARLPEDMHEYVNVQRPKTISEVIHHTMIASRIHFQDMPKKPFKTKEGKDKHDNRPKDGTPAKENKAKSKGQY